MPRNRFLGSINIKKSTEQKGQYKIGPIVFVHLCVAQLVFGCKPFFHIKKRTIYTVEGNETKLDEIFNFATTGIYLMVSYCGNEIMFSL